MVQESLNNIAINVLYRIEQNIIHIHYNDSYSHGVHEIYNFGRPFLGHDYYILSLSDLCLGVKKIFKGTMHFHFMTYIATPQHKNPCPGGHEIYNFVDPSLVMITIHLVCLNHAPEKRRRLLEKYINFTLFIPKLHPIGMGIMKFTIPCLLSLRMLHTKFG